MTAVALAGDLTFNPITDFIENQNGEKVKLDPPKGYELPPKGFDVKDQGFQAPDPNKKNVEVIVNPDSERLQLLDPFNKWNGKDLTDLKLLIRHCNKGDVIAILRF